jgi:hypothetical protein
MTDATSEQMLLDSKLAGSTLDQDMDGNKFKYINCLDREYFITPFDITSVEFDISRYGKFTHTITFPDPVCEKEAIEKVEEYLSEPLTEKYYDVIS